MKTNTNNKQANNNKVDNKSVSAARQAAQQQARKYANAIIAEKKTVKGVLLYISLSDTPEAKSYRDWLGLPKNANKQQRKAAAAWLASRWVYANRKIYITDYYDAEAGGYVVTRSVGDLVPCRSNGKQYTDIMLALRDTRERYDGITAARKEIARQMIETRHKMQALGVYREHIDGVLSYTHRAPGKIQGTKILNDIIVECSK